MSKFTKLQYSKERLVKSNWKLWVGFSPNSSLRMIPAHHSNQAWRWIVLTGHEYRPACRRTSAETHPAFVQNVSHLSPCGSLASWGVHLTHFNFWFKATRLPTVAHRLWDMQTTRFTRSHAKLCHTMRSTMRSDNRTNRSLGRGSV